MTDDPLVDAVVGATGEDAATVREILGAIDVLEIPPPRPPAPRLLLTRIAFEGKKPAKLGGEMFQYERDLAGGVNLWKAPNLKGKSTVLRTIRWALTGGVGTDARTTQDWITSATLDFSLDSVAHRIRFTHAPPRQHEGSIERAREGGWEPIATFRSQTQHEVMTRQFFADAFGLDRLSWTQHKANSLETTEGHATWGTYFNGLFLDEQAYDELVGGVGPVGNVGPKVLAALLGLSDLVRINRLQLARDGLRVQGEAAKIARAVHGGTEASLSKAKNTLEEELLALRERLAAQPKQTDLQAALAESDAARSALVAATGKVADLTEEVRARAAARAAAEAQRRMLQDSVEFKVFFNGIEVTHCPRCEQPVEEAAKAREASEHACRVCSRAVPSETDDDVAALRDELTAAEKRMTQSQDAEQRTSRQLETAERALDGARERVDAAALALQAVTIGTAPLLDRRDQLNQSIGQLQGRIESMRVPTDAEMDQRDRIYVAAVEELQARQAAEDRALLDAFTATATDLAHRFGMPDIERVAYDRDKIVRIVEAGEDKTFEKLSVGGQQRLKIAILLAIALLAKKRDEVRHPRVLFIDAPGGHEMVAADVAAIAKALRGLEREQGDDVQVLVACALDQIIGATVKAKSDIRDGYLF